MWHCFAMRSAVGGVHEVALVIVPPACRDPAEMQPPPDAALEARTWTTYTCTCARDELLARVEQCTPLSRSLGGIGGTVADGRGEWGSDRRSRSHSADDVKRKLEGAYQRAATKAVYLALQVRLALPAQ